MLADLEIQAKEGGLEFIEELIFENGAVYRGKSLLSNQALNYYYYLHRLTLSILNYSSVLI